MAEQFLSTIAQEFPEVIEAQNILNLASITWPKYGISALDLSEMDMWRVTVLETLVRG